MTTLNNFFDKIYCINLDKRKDRWSLATSEFNKFNIEVQRFSAIDGSTLNTSNIKMSVLKGSSKPGAIGCSLSHVNVIQDAKNKGYSKILILEDDVVFEDNLIKRFSKEVAYLPEDWDMFYLSGNNRGENALQKVNDYFYKTRFTYTTHCYALNSNVYDIIIEGVSRLEEPIDQFYKKFMQQKHNCYVIRPHLSYQRAGYSDIMGGLRDYKRIRL